MNLGLDSVDIILKRVSENCAAREGDRGINDKSDATQNEIAVAVAGRHSLLI